MKTVHEEARELPVVREVDVVVVGGGTAGIGAAVASARMGADTLLLERYGSLGGMMAGGLVTLLPRTDVYDPGTPVFGGVMTEIVQGLKRYDAIWDIRGQGRSLSYDPEVMKFLANQMTEEAGANLRLHTWATSALTQGNRITAVITETKAGREAILTQAVVDTSGDGDMAEFSGAPFEAGIKIISVMHKIGGIDDEKFRAYVKEHREEYLKKWQEAALQHSPGSGQTWKRLKGIHLRHGADLSSKYLAEYSAISPDDLTFIEVEARKMMMKAIEFYRQNLPGYEKVTVIETAAQIGTRESRRVTGDYVLTIEDVKEGRRFKDAICRIPQWRSKDLSKDFFEVPYRSIYSKKIENLYVGGRCISVEHKAQDPIRLIPQCVVTGQAAGTAAALAVRDGRPAREVEAKELCDELCKAGVALGE